VVLLRCGDEILFSKSSYLGNYIKLIITLGRPISSIKCWLPLMPPEAATSKPFGYDHGPVSFSPFTRRPDRLTTRGLSVTTGDFNVKDVAFSGRDLLTINNMS
jgi:hypothetical protein